jgi:hypothetical protein
MVLSGKCNKSPGAPPFAKSAKDGAPAYSWCFLPCQTPTAA